MSYWKRPTGYLMIDHRASPGIPGTQLKEGSLFEADTLRCAHCATVSIKRPDRTRARPHCLACDSYICDVCDVARNEPLYVHRSFDQIADMVRSGRFEVSGSSAFPILTPKGV